jgi:mersacidin/lichenicidin family type 2 lantibiotic
MAEDTGSVPAYVAPQHPLGRMYAHRALDSVVELAYALSADFLERPGRYRDAPDDIATLLTQFHGFTGSNAEWPAAEQRTATSNGALVRLSGEMANLRRAAIIVSERGSRHSETLLRRALLESASSLRSSARWIEGSALDVGEGQIRSMFERAEQILRREEIARTFGLPALPPGAWPDGGIYSVEAAYLCEVVTSHLAHRGRLEYISQPKFGILQRVAYYGSIAISCAMDPSFEEEDHSTELISTAYGWATALQNLLSHLDIVRVWTDVDYRARLQAVERDMLPPHPAGEIEYGALMIGPWGPRPGGGAPPSGPILDQTYTVSGEVCCSSGDVGCPNNQPSTDDCPTETATCN